MAGEEVVQLSKHAGQVALDLDEPGPKRPDRQLHLGEIDGAHRRAAVAVLDQLARDFDADALLRLLGRTADMRRQNDIVQACSGEWNFSAFELGSTGKTSIAAPRSRPSR